MDLLGKLIAEVVGFWHDETKNRPIDLELAVEIHDGILFLKMVENRRSGLRVGASRRITIGDVLMDAGGKLVSLNLKSMVDEIGKVGPA